MEPVELNKAELSDLDGEEILAQAKLLADLFDEARRIETRLLETFQNHRIGSGFPKEWDATVRMFTKKSVDILITGNGNG